MSTLCLFIRFSWRKSIISILFFSTHLSYSQDCGIERWSIKTLSDKDTTKINFQIVTPTTVSEQARMMGPNFSPTSRLDSEITVLSIDCLLIGYKRSLDDKDIHVIIEDINTDATMVIEIPSHECTEIQKTSRYNLFKNLEEWFIENVGYPQPFFTYLEHHTPVTITGIGFFDSHHGQIGMTGNGREIHPVLSIVLR